MSNEKQSVVTSVQGNGTWDSSYGLFYKWEIAFENGDVGEYLSKTNPQSKFSIGGLSWYIKEVRKTANGEFVKIKPAQNPSLDSQKSAKHSANKDNVDWDAKDRRIVRQNALSHATSLVASGKVKLNELISFAERFESWVYRDDNNLKTKPLEPQKEVIQVPQKDVSISHTMPPLESFSETPDDLPF